MRIIKIVESEGDSDMAVTTSKSISDQLHSCLQKIASEGVEGDMGSVSRLIAENKERTAALRGMLSNPDAIWREHQDDLKRFYDARKQEGINEDIGRTKALLLHDWVNKAELDPSCDITLGEIKKLCSYMDRLDPSFKRTLRNYIRNIPKGANESTTLGEINRIKSRDPNEWMTHILTQIHNTPQEMLQKILQMNPSEFWERLQFEPADAQKTYFTSSLIFKLYLDVHDYELFVSADDVERWVGQFKPDIPGMVLVTMAAKELLERIRVLKEVRDDSDSGSSKADKKRATDAILDDFNKGIITEDQMKNKMKEWAARKTTKVVLSKNDWIRMGKIARWIGGDKIRPEGKV